MTTTQTLNLFTDREIDTPGLPGAPVGDSSAPYQSGSATSKAAAEAVAPRVRGQKLRILEALAWHDLTCASYPVRGEEPEKGLTREELVQATGFYLQAVCGRLSEKETGLLPLGLVRVEGTRKGSSGVEQEVLHITEAGRAVLEAEGVGK